MKITVKGSKLVEKLKAQRERALAKKQEAEAFLAEHTKHHKKEEPAAPREEKAPGLFGRRAAHGPAICIFEMQVKALTAHIDGHVRRLDAAIEVIDADREVEMSLSKYVNSYVDGPYDGVTFPPPESSDDAGPAQGLMAQGVQKLN